MRSQAGAVMLAFLATAVGALVPVPPPSAPATGAPGLVLHPNAVERSGWINETSITAVQAPSPYGYTAAVYDSTDGYGVAFGGIGPNGQVVGTTWSFDDGNWENLTRQLVTGSPPPLSSANLAFDVADGYVLLFGGRTSSGALSNSTWSYHNYSWTLRAGPSAPPGEAGGAMAYDSESRSVLLLDPSFPGTWSYHGGAWSSQSDTTAPFARTGAVMASDPSSGGVMLFGGTALRPGSAALNDTWYHHSGQWSRITGGVGPPPLMNASATDDPATGGVFLAGSSASGGTQSWNFSGNAWKALSNSVPGPPARRGATLLYDATGISILCGGTDLSGARFLDDCWGWGIPIVPPDLSRQLPPVPESVLLAAGLAVGVPVAVALLLSLRPRRRDPVRAAEGRARPSGA